MYVISSNIRAVSGGSSPVETLSVKEPDERNRGGIKRSDFGFVVRDEAVLELGGRFIPISFGWRVCSRRR